MIRRNKMETYFAPGERAGRDKLKSDIEILSDNPVINGLLRLVNSIIVIVNKQRQILAVNDTFLRTFDIEGMSGLLGLRTGEALQCIHAGNPPAGCGTTKHCSTCGAAIAMVSSFEKDKPVEKICALTIEKGDKLIDKALNIRSQPINIEGERFLLLFIQDITLQHQLAALERAFFHDLCNLLSGIIGASDLLSAGGDQSKLINIIQRSSVRLQKEVEIQRSLMDNGSELYQPLYQEVVVSELFDELRNSFSEHRLKQNRFLEIADVPPDITLRTDFSLVFRILCNMISNALEAAEEQGLVKLWFDRSGSRAVFSVHNNEKIPDKISYRIFQRNFSTKNGNGRGTGTFSMKLFGEKILGGEVGFTSTEEDGTVFRISLPA